MNVEMFSVIACFMRITLFVQLADDLHARNSRSSTHHSNHSPILCPLGMVPYSMYFPRLRQWSRLESRTESKQDHSTTIPVQVYF